MALDSRPCYREAMARKRKAPEAQFNLDGTTASPLAQTEPNAGTVNPVEQSSDRAERPAPAFETLSIRVLPDGSIDPSTRESTRAKIRRFAEANPQVFGPPAAPAPAANFDPEISAVLYRLLGTLEAEVAIWRGSDPAIAREVFSYSEQEIEALKGPTTKVLNKYAGGMTKYEDEMNLAFVLLSVHVSKIRALKAATSAKAEREQYQAEAGGASQAKE